MTEYVLTIVDTVGVQDYIFATNNLRQNAGASFLADCATSAWVHEVLDSVASAQHNVIALNSKEDKYKLRVNEGEECDPCFGKAAPCEFYSIEKDKLQAELIYSGGGNAVLLFDTLERAKDFTQELTRKVMIRAPGLRVMVQHTAFVWETEALGGKTGVLEGAFRALKAHKQSTPPSYPVLGLGVSTRCVFSGLPVVDYDKDKRPVAAVADAKERQEFNRREPADRNTAHGRLLDALEFRGFAPARDFDKLGVALHESSLIALVHADGNSMGKRIEAMRDRHLTADDNRAYLNELRCFSASVKKASQRALQATIDLLLANLRFNEKDKIYYIPAEPNKDTIEGAVILAYDEEADCPVLPFRPIVLGGDDTTFVCEGRLGLFLATYYLQKFSAQTLSDQEAAHCRAGVALVPLHFPFSRAYELAGALCASARRSIEEWKEKYSPDKQHGVTAIDWHFAIGGMVRDLRDVRRLEYTSASRLDSELVGTGDLLMRPLRLDAHDTEWRSWPVFIETVRAFRGLEAWRNRHNKVKALREALRKGDKAVVQFRRVYAVDKLPEIHKDYKSFSEEGWQGNRCGYFDAIEAMDRLIELDTTRTLAPLGKEQEAA